MKNQALFSSKDKSKKLKCRQLQFLIGALRINKQIWTDFSSFKLATAADNRLSPAVFDQKCLVTTGCQQPFWTKNGW